MVVTVKVWFLVPSAGIATVEKNLSSMQPFVMPGIQPCPPVCKVRGLYHCNTQWWCQLPTTKKWRGQMKMAVRGHSPWENFSGTPPFHTKEIPFWPPQNTLICLSNSKDSYLPILTHFLEGLRRIGRLTSKKSGGGGLLPHPPMKSTTEKISTKIPVKTIANSQHFYMTRRGKIETANYSKCLTFFIKAAWFLNVRNI